MAPTGQATVGLSREYARTQPAANPEEEPAHMREAFQTMVRQPTLERLDHYKKLWAGSAKIAQAMEERRQRLTKLDKTYLDFVSQDVRAELAKAGLGLQSSQYFLYADRNPQAQMVIVGFYNSSKDNIDFVGEDLISSGNLEKGGDYFLTPVGVFENVLDNFSYRAWARQTRMAGEGWEPRTAGSGTSAIKRA